MNKLLTGYKWSQWLYGLWAAVIGGGATAAYGSLSVIILDPKDFNPQTTKFYQLAGLMFAFGAALAFFSYLKEHPLPDIIASETHESVNVRQIPLKGTGDGTRGNAPALLETVTTKTEKKIEVAPTPPTDK